MPSTDQHTRDLMEKWFGDPIADGPPYDFLLSHGYIEPLRNGVLYKPTLSHTISYEEFWCVKFLIEEWDYALFREGPDWS